jgi:hypothetical protein
MGHPPFERARMRIALFLFACCSFVCSTFGSSSPNTNILDLLIVAGAPGEKEFARDFQDAVQDWVNACRAGNKSFQVIEALQTNQLEQFTAVVTNQPSSEQEFWIVLIGHGTFDGKDAKFNLAGPDLSAMNCAQILTNVQRPIIFIDTSSASAPFINQLSGTNRIIITATKNGFEENYTRFGKFFAKTFSDLSADLDKDGQVSLLEAFLGASHQVEDFYKGERRLSTEHALLDDNGDGKGTPATFYRGVRPAKKSDEAAAVDGFRAHQIHFVPNEAEARLTPALRKKRNDLELDLEKLRADKALLTEDAYLEKVEPLLLELAKLYRDAEKSAAQQK